MQYFAYQLCSALFRLWCILQVLHAFHVVPHVEIFGPWTHFFNWVAAVFNWQTANHFERKAFLVHQWNLKS